MINNYYPIEISSDLITFEFISEGPKGKIVKFVEFKEIGANLYNLGFGDKDDSTGIANDLSITNNGDSKKVLWTVAATVNAFSNKYRNAIIVAAGSTRSRTRLYQMSISNNLEIIEKDYLIMGLNLQDEWVPFERGVTYGAFLIKRKS